MSICSGDLNPNLDEYNENAIKVLLGIFDAEHGKNYQTPTSFLQALWNAADPSMGTA
jgi:hypothetical protein